jgi:PEGA domain
MKSIWVARAFALGAAAAVWSCALLTQGTTEEIQVNSDPPGATVRLNNGETGVTPFSTVVPREQDIQFHFSKPGYQSADLSDNSQVEAGYLVADTIPLLIPWMVDASSGAGFAHQQTAVTARLDPVDGSRTDDAQRESIAPSLPATPFIGAASSKGAVN